MITQQLLEYIKQRKQQGLSDKDIKTVLSIEGWQSQVIDEAFYLVENPSPFGQNSEHGSKPTDKA